MKVYLLTADRVLLRNVRRDSGLEVLGVLPKLVNELASADLVLVDSAVGAQQGLDVLCRLTARGLPNVLLLREPSLALTLAARACGSMAAVALPMAPGTIQDFLQTAATVATPWRESVAAPEQPIFVGASQILQDCFRAVTAASASDTPVLIKGERGTGKSLLARITHQHGVRAGGAFVAVNCVALDDNLLAAELFGRDAVLGSPVTGQLARAAGGTLVLEDVAQLSGALLRRIGTLLDDQSFTALGAVESKPLQARIIATSVEPPHELVGHFPIRVTVPPLRAHPEDIAPLSAFFLEETAGDRGLQMDAEALAALQDYEWPGNIRQLKHVIERVVAFAEDGLVKRRHLPPEVLGRTDELPAMDTRETSLATVERRHIREVWRMTGGHISETADLLGIHRNTLRRKLEDYGIMDP